MNTVEETRENRQRKRLSIKIAAIYAAVGALWIFFSDRMAAVFSDTPQGLTQIATIKGWLYVLLTAVLLYYLVSRGVKRLEESQEAFLKSEEQYRVLVETTETGYAIFDQQGKVIDANVHYAKLTGHNSSQEILGRSVTEWTAAYDVERITEEVRKCREKKFTRHLRMDYVDKSGNIIPVEMNSTSIPSAEGTVILALCVDISERKRAEDALKESEMRFRSIFEHTAVGVAQVESRTGCFARVNRKFCDIVGYSPEEMLGRGFQSITHPDDLEASLRNTARLTAGEIGSYTMEKRYIHRSGETVWVNLTVSPLWAAGEEQDFHVGVVEDITERKRAEESLAKSNERICHLNDVLRAIRDVGSLINREKDPIGLLSAVCDSLVQTRGYVTVWIGKPEADSKRLLPVAHSGVDADCLERFQITWDESPTGQGPAGIAMRERHAVVFDDITTDPRFAPWKDYVLAAGRASITSVPIIHEERIFGVLTVKADRPYAFDLEEVELLSNLAADLARALQSLENESARKHVEEALRASEEKFRLAFETSPDSINLNRVHDGMYLDSNDGFTKMTGYAREDVIGKTSLELNIWDDPQDRQRLVAGLEREGFVENLEARFRGKDGRIIIGLMSARVLRIDHEDVLLSITRDITERKRAEAALLETESQFKSFAEQALAGIYILQNGVFKYVNAKFAQMFGYTIEECLNDMPFKNLVYAEDLASVEEQVRKRTSGEVQFVQHTFRGLKKNGQIFPVEVYGAMSVYKGEPAGTGTILDITERKRAEEEQEKLKAQLFQAQKMESVGRLAGGVAHDFNNMLGVIIGRAEMALEQDAASDKLQRNLKEILKAGLRSADLTRQLLAFARKQTANPKILDLNDTISGTLKMLRRLIGEDIDLFWVPELDLWKVKIDPSQMDQILANLVVNARDAISGVGAITLRTENVVIDDSDRVETPEFIPGEYVLLTMGDTGVGMSEEVRENIFEPFFTTKELGKGTGLGLSTVYGIVKQNDGFIYVASELGKGATFRIYLPRFEAEASQDSPEKTAGKPPTGTETILVVEDDEAILNLSKTILEHLGYTVLTAQTPVQAINLVREHAGELHLLITDVVMPEMNGRVLAEQLSALRQNLKCLYMSGYTADVIAHRGILDEGVNFIQKPFGSDDLAARVRQVLDYLE